MQCDEYSTLFNYIGVYFVRKKKKEKERETNCSAQQSEKLEGKL